MQINSNIHNCIHIVNQVRQYGVLNNFSAYRFENALFQIKRKVRHGYKPLEQVAGRIVEGLQFNKYEPQLNKNLFPKFSKKRGNRYLIVEFAENVFFNEGKNHDSYFLTIKTEIIKVQHCEEDHQTNITYFVGSEILNKSNLFTYPVNSMYLYVYKTTSETGPVKRYNINDLKCKLIKINCDENIVFIPLMHSFDAF